MIEVKAPGPYDAVGTRKIFLAGSIEMGVAEDWQSRVASALADRDGLIVLNPRRDDWDSTWKQSQDDPRFAEQVAWELNGLEAADLVLMYFAPGTKSPVTLLELGLCAGRGKELVVCCPEGFWRKGNVDMVCQRYGARTVADLPALIETARASMA